MKDLKVKQTHTWFKKDLELLKKLTDKEPYIYSNSAMLNKIVNEYAKFIKKA